MFHSDASVISATCRQCSHKSEGQTSNNYEEEIKNKILEAALPFVRELGWSKEAISEGAKVVGYPAITHGMFTRGGADLVHYFQKSSNYKLVGLLKQVLNVTIFIQGVRHRKIPLAAYEEMLILMQGNIRVYGYALFIDNF